MMTARLRVLRACSVVADVTALTAAFALARGLAVRMDAGARLATMAPGGFGILLVCWIAAFAGLGLYGGVLWSTARDDRRRVAGSVALAAGLSLAGAVATGGVTEADLIGAGVFVAAGWLLVVAARSGARSFVATLAPRRVIVGGDRDEAIRVAARFDDRRRWGVTVAGLVTDGRWADADPLAWPVLGAVADLPELARRAVVDEVILVPAPGHPERLVEYEETLLGLDALGITTRIAANFLPRSTADLSLDRLGALPLLTFSTSPRQEGLIALRRAADLVLAAVLLALLSPVLAAIAVAITLESRGPVLFRQTRCGRGGRPFTFLKFRSMRVGADRLKPALAVFNEMNGPAFKMTNDPRVTRVGRRLRRTSLDELPQLWNVLKGDMSFVGPRPAVEEEVALYAPWQRRRLSMPPGLTCLWQVSGRSQLSFDEWMRLDLEYIDNWSLWLDLKIAVKTVSAVLLGRGAR